MLPTCRIGGGGGGESNKKKEEKCPGKKGEGSEEDWREEKMGDLEMFGRRKARGGRERIFGRKLRREGGGGRSVKEGGRRGALRRRRRRRGGSEMDWREEAEDRRIRGGVIYLGSAMGYAHSEHLICKNADLTKINNIKYF